MSQHPSFKSSSNLQVKRNVLKRFERVELLRKRGEWKEGDRVVSLRKTKPAGLFSPSPLNRCRRAFSRTDFRAGKIRPADQVSSGHLECPHEYHKTHTKSVIRP
jgi:small basic protein (TIGR04137 family)